MPASNDPVVHSLSPDDRGIVVLEPQYDNKWCQVSCLSVNDFFKNNVSVVSQHKVMLENMRDSQYKTMYRHRIYADWMGGED